MTFKITFTEGPKIAAVWTGYASYSDARSAIVDADLCIPFWWNYSIEAEG